MFDALGLSPGALLYCLLAVFGAGLVRGYSGFGFSALVMTSLALVLPPAQIVPVTLLLEVLATGILYRDIREHIAWRLLGWLLLGAAVTMPLGVLALSYLPADVMRVVVSVLVLMACALLWRGFQPQIAWHGRGPALGAGVVSGLANGAAAIGGLPVVLYFLAAAVPPAVARATIMVFLLLINVYGTAVTYLNGLVDTQALLRLALLALPALAGVLLGHRRFTAAAPESFRRFALLLLVLLALLGLGRSLVGLL